MENTARSPETVIKIETRDLSASSSPDPSSPSETRGKRITVKLLSSAPPGGGMELIYDGNQDAMVVVDHGRKSYIVAAGWMRASPASGVSAMTVSDTGERATKQGYLSRKVDLHPEGGEAKAIWIAGGGEGADDDVLPAPVASMVQFAISYQQAEQRLNQAQLLGGGDDDDDDEDDKPPEDDNLLESRSAP